MAAHTAAPALVLAMLYSTATRQAAVIVVTVA
jgi:hypothetical protein